MKNGNNSHLVFTLEDEISNEVLKSKNVENQASGSSSVALWIKSLKENNDGYDHDSKSDQENHSSCSDQDDLNLGAEATYLGRKHRTYRQSTSIRDSDSDSSNRWYSWTGRRSFLINRLSYDRSLDSDTSGLSSVTSVSSLLTARESDPEDVLKGLGFRGPSVLDKIPGRFIDTGTICDGVDSEQFLCSVQDESEDAVYMNSELPPWIVARFDEIPRKFWNQKEDLLVTSDSTELGGQLANINELSSDEAKEEAAPPRLSKVCPSKFGTYLEPVTEEVELSSQGSAAVSPNKTLSFESTRSTLKANSQDSHSETMPKIPSLCDLWSATEDEQETYSEPIRSEEHGANTGTDIPGGIDQVGNLDWIDKSRDDSQLDQRNAFPALTDIQQTEDIPAVPWLSPPPDNLVPALTVYLTDNDTDKHKISSQAESELTNNRSLEVNGNDVSTVENDFTNVSNSQTISSKKAPKLTIPTVTISEPVEKTRKISTVQASDLEKLLPILQPANESEETGKNSKKGKTCNEKQTNTTQLTLYGAQQWAVMEDKRRAQVQFSHKAKPRSPRKLSTRSRKTTDIGKVTVTSVSLCKKAKQVPVPACELENIQCFSHIDAEDTLKPNKSDFDSVQGSHSPESCKNGNDSISLPAAQTDVYCNRKESGVHTSGAQEKRNTTEVYSSDGQESSKKEKCVSAESSKCGTRSKNSLSVEGELNELETSLKGVKMYKAGIHLMQLASSVETVMSSEKQPRRSQLRSSERLLDSIQKELKHLEEYLLKLQKQLKGIKKQTRNEEMEEDVRRRGSDFSDITRQLLQEQVKMFNSISSAAVSPASTPSVSRAESLCSETPDVLRHTDVMKLRKELQQIRQDSQEQTATMKDEILAEVRAEIRNCFKEFLATRNCRRSQRENMDDEFAGVKS